MEAAHDASFYKVLLIVLASTAIVIPLVQRLRLPAVLGYMVVGMGVGPFGAGALVGEIPVLSVIAIEDRAAIEPVAELGVALLMFMIGLELSLERIWLMRRMVFGLGTIQLVSCALVLGLIATLLGYAPPAAVVVGLALAMSSTAIVLQVLAEQRRLGTAPGRASFAVLLLQDLAVVPVLFGLAALAPDGEAQTRGSFLLAMGQALVVVGGIVGFGRLVLRPLFRSVARMHSQEFFVAACLLVVMTCGLAVVSVGMSMALGALIGGLLLAGTEYRRQVEVTIEPFKGLLLGIFLISIGMTLDWRALLADVWLVASLSAGLILVKAGLVTAAGKALGLGWKTGWQTGLLLGPGGEFGFVVAAGALMRHIIDRDTASLLLLVVAVTMATIPLMPRLGGIRSARDRDRPIDPSILPPDFLDGTQRVIIAGFGRVGALVAQMLEHHAIAYVAIDRDPDQVARVRATNGHVYYGDLTNPALLRHLQLSSTSALVVTVDDAEMARALVTTARAERPDLVIVARARDANHAAGLYRLGATDAVPETIESSLQLAEAVLVELGVAMGPIIVSIHEKRAELQEGIKTMAPETTVRPRGQHRLRDML